MSIIKYKLDYEVINHLKEFNNMTFEDSKKFMDIGISDLKHLELMHCMAADLSFIEMVESCFEDTFFEIDELRETIIESFKYHEKDHSMGENINDVINDMNGAIDRCILSECFKEVE